MRGTTSNQVKNNNERIRSRSIEADIFRNTPTMPKTIAILKNNLTMTMSLSSLWGNLFTQIRLSLTDSKKIEDREASIDRASPKSISLPRNIFHRKESSQKANPKTIAARARKKKKACLDLFC